MAIVAELHLSSPDLFLGHASRAIPDTVLSVEYQGGPSELLFSATGGDLDALEEAIEADPTIADHWTVMDLDGRRIYGATVAIERPFLSRILLAEGSIIHENSVADGEWHLTLELPDQDALSGIGAFCEEHGISMRVERLYVERQPDASDRFGLTAAQREALLVAHERGYFNDPRDVTLEELAAELDVSATALGRRMRRALDSLIERTIRADNR